MTSIFLDRRSVILTLAATPFVLAAAPEPDGGFVIDWQGGPQPPELVASLAAQIAIVRGLEIDPTIAAFFAQQVITVDLAEDTHTRAGPRGVFFERRPLPPENPVLLHELIHRFHLLRLPQGRQNPGVIAFYRQAVASGRWPAQAYMLTNPMEFLAMTASTVLFGRAARPPFTRANVAEKAPELYAWILRTFGLRLP